MATWDTLAPEIHDIILKFFYRELVARYLQKLNYFDPEEAIKESKGP